MENTWLGYVIRIGSRSSENRRSRRRNVAGRWACCLSLTLDLHYPFPNETISQTLSSYDQFSNFILQNAVERRSLNTDAGTVYCDIPLGLYVVRGDSMVLMGKVSSHPQRVVSIGKEVSLQELQELEKQQQQQNESKEGDDVDAELKWDFDNDLVA